MSFLIINPATAAAVAAPLPLRRHRWLRVLYILRKSWPFWRSQKTSFPWRIGLKYGFIQTSRPLRTECSLPHVEIRFGSVFMTVWKSRNLGPGRNLLLLLLLFLPTVSVSDALWPFYRTELNEILYAASIQHCAWTSFIIFPKFEIFFCEKLCF